MCRKCAHICVHQGVESEQAMVCRMPISRVCLSGECIHVLRQLPHETASFQCCNCMSSVLLSTCYSM